MADLEGTFPMLDPGTLNDPDFYSGPDAIASTEIAEVVELVEKNAPNVTVKYRKRDIRDSEPQSLIQKLKANWPTYEELMGKAQAGTLTNAEAQQAIFYAMKAGELLVRYVLGKKPNE